MLVTFSKYFLRLVLVVVCLLFVIIVGINSYLALSGIKEKIALRAQEIVGKPLQLGSLYFLPWSGLHLKSLTIIDPTYPCVLHASSLSLNVWSILHVLQNPAYWTSEVRIKKIFLNNHLIFRKTVINMVRKNEVFAMDPLITKVLDGTLQGSLIIEPSSEGVYSYQGNLSCVNISLQQLLLGTTFQQRVSSGFLAGTAHLSGIVGRGESLAGSGAFQLLSAQLKTADFFGPLSRFFPIEELRLLKLQEAKTSVTFSSDGLHVDSAYFKSDNMALTSHGNISFQGKVDLVANVVLAGKLATSLQGVLPSELISMISQTGCCDIPFQIYGSLANLKTNFLEKILNQQIPSNVGGVLQQFLHDAMSAH